MTTRLRSHHIARWVVRLLAAVMIPLIVFVTWNQMNYNFAPVQSGRIYRSGQMPAGALAYALRDKRIKTVLNLRGSNSQRSWYRDELTATLRAGATQIDIAMSSCLWMSRVQLRALVDTLDTAEYPILVHCAWGSERTGLAAAFAELLRPGRTLDDARAQFSIWYLFVPVGDGRVMEEHLDEYETWLRKERVEHSPANFRLWAHSGFQPRHPSREDWRLGDPYPLVVITRPDSAPKPQPIASEVSSSPARK
jgi:protein tyrosine phosphatase (PTP) superfamily phosphohydrolase (DUF442 family)